MFCTRKWERGGLIYVKYFKVKSWKSKLPDAATWFEGGFPKKKLLRRDLNYLHEFRTETCRGEAAHWATMFCCPLFFVWNPLWASLAMIAYAVLSNVPCIVTQRYNRVVIERMLVKGLRVRG